MPEQMQTSGAMVGFQLKEDLARDFDIDERNQPLADCFFGPPGVPQARDRHQVRAWNSSFKKLNVSSVANQRLPWHHHLAESICALLLHIRSFCNSAVSKYAQILLNWVRTCEHKSHS
jgi:hypothetical protein